MQAEIYKWIPGLLLFKGYKRKWFSKDLLAGLSVASIALPIGIAYAGIAGLPPEVGLYSTILPMIAYALFGTSKQLIIGPDSTICILIAAALSVFAAEGPEKYASMSILLSVLIGAFCIAAGLFRLGFITNFLSKPILNGFFNGTAISVIMGQLGKLFGFSLISGGFFRQVIDFISKIDQTNVITLIIGISSLLLLVLLKKTIPKIPAPLIAVIGGICAVFYLNLEKSGVSIVGAVPAGLPSFGFVSFNFEEITMLSGSALSIVFIGYCNTMLANKGFALKNDYEINANQEFIALGVSNIFSGFSHGFAVCGIASRTAVSDTAGGKTQLTSIIASLTLLLILLFFTFMLSWLPLATLAAIIISACVGLFNFEYMKRLYMVSKREFASAAFTSLCVITIGVLPAVLIAIGLALLRLVAKAAYPKDAVLGKVETIDTYQDISEYENAKTIPGLIIYRFEASLLFFNADNMRNRIRSLVASSKEKPKTVLIDTSTFLTTDITGVETLGELWEDLNKQNITLAIARPNREFYTILKRTGIAQNIGKENIFSSIREGVESFQKRVLESV